MLSGWTVTCQKFTGIPHIPRETRPLLYSIISIHTTRNTSTFLTCQSGCIYLAVYFRFGLASKNGLYPTELVQPSP
jgi:hypothetical protein